MYGIRALLALSTHFRREFEGKIANKTCKLVERDKNKIDFSQFFILFSIKIRFCFIMQILFKIKWFKIFIKILLCRKVYLLI